MSWLIRISQSKPMALPFPYSVDRGTGGVNVIDSIMTDETANRERQEVVPGYLGEGAMGVATALPSGYVGKYTDDEDEMKIAEYFKSKNVPCIVKIYSTRTVQELPPIYMIVMEKVRTLSQLEASIIRDIRRVSDIEIAEMLQKGDNSYFDSLKERHNYENRINDHKLIDDYLEMRKCMSANGVARADTHGGNVGYNSEGKMVLLDLGFTRMKEPVDGMAPLRN